MNTSFFGEIFLSHFLEHAEGSNVCGVGFLEGFIQGLFGLVGYLTHDFRNVVFRAAQLFRHFRVGLVFAEDRICDEREIRNYIAL